MKNTKLKNMLYIVLITVFLCISITGTIQRFKCVKMTETELFLYIPKSIVCDWKICN